VPAKKIKAAFTEPMLLVPARELPEGERWAYELKLDGYRALAIKTDEASAPPIAEQGFQPPVSRGGEGPCGIARRDRCDKLLIQQLTQPLRAKPSP
jgi:hypothetical protein